MYRRCRGGCCRVGELAKKEEKEEEEEEEEETEEEKLLPTTRVTGLMGVTTKAVTILLAQKESAHRTTNGTAFARRVLPLCDSSSSSCLIIFVAISGSREKAYEVWVVG